MKRKRLDILLAILLTIICISVFILPYGIIYNPADGLKEDERWMASYILDDDILAMFFISFSVFWGLFLFLAENIFRKIARFVLLGISFFSLVLSVGNTILLVQDFVPGWGAYISLFIFPVLVLYLLNNGSLNKTRTKSIP